MNPFDLHCEVTVEKIIKKDSESYTAVRNVAKLLNRLSELQNEQEQILDEIRKQYAHITLTADISDISLVFWK